MSQKLACKTKECSTPAKVAERTFHPRVDISETDNALILTADMPGVAEDSVDITLHKGVLTIEAEREAPTFEGVNPAYVESVAGRYQRKFKVTEDIERDAIEATLKNGVLRVTLPKAEAQLAQKIKVVPA